MSEYSCLHFFVPVAYCWPQVTINLLLSECFSKLPAVISKMVLRQYRIVKPQTVNKRYKEKEKKSQGYKSLRRQLSIKIYTFKHSNHTKRMSFDIFHTEHVIL